MRKLIFSLLAIFLAGVMPSWAQNRVVVIMVDGFRWQELYHGADSTLINNPEFGNVEMMKAKFWRASADERREALMPFT
ncbi:MAG: hypothetical protein UFJ02_03790 [Prevotella sp.]|nr:hypothetical protein [Prevotella sp.]